MGAVCAEGLWWQERVVRAGVAQVSWGTVQEAQRSGDMGSCWPLCPHELWPGTPCLREPWSSAAKGPWGWV